jgi:5-methylcytosine-specific restriction endonuclease McrA
MSKFDTTYARQGGRCFWCQSLVPVAAMTRDHIHPRKGGQRTRNGGDYILACAKCNKARSALTIGSIRFEKWIRAVINGKDAFEVAHKIQSRRRFQIENKLKRELYKPCLLG